MEGEAERSVIGPDLIVRGELSSSGKISIHGRVEGEAKANAIVIEKEGVVKGTLSADTIAVAGNMEGTVLARSVDIKAGARVEADVQQETIVVAVGAVLLGQIRQRPYNAENGRSAETKAPTAS